MLYLKNKILVLLIFTLILASCQYYQKSPVEIELIDSADNELVEDTALAARGDVVVSARYNAYVLCYNEGVYFRETELPIGSIDVKLGDYVKKGDSLITLNTESIDKLIDEKLDYIEDYRIRSNFETELKKYDIMIAELKLAQESSKDKDTIKKLNYELDMLTLELQHMQERQESDIARQYSQLENLKSRRDKAVLEAPFDGRVVYIANIVPGGNITAFTNVVYLADESKIFVKMEPTRMDPSKSKRITGRISDREYELSFIPLTKEEITKYRNQYQSPDGGLIAPYTFNFENADEFIKPGQYAALNLISTSVENVITVPANSIYYKDEVEGDYVYVIEDGKRVLRNVTVGIVNESFAEIKSGINEGDEVVVRR